MDYNSPNTNKINSVFKKLYNLELRKKSPNSRLIIKKENIMKYNLNNCINDNINGINSRFLLIEVNRSM